MALPRIGQNGLYLWTGLDPLRVQWSPRASRNILGEETEIDPRRQASPLMAKPELSVRPNRKALEGLGFGLGDSIYVGKRANIPNVDFIRGVPGAPAWHIHGPGITPREYHPALVDWRVVGYDIYDRDHITQMWRLLLEKATFFGGRIELCSLPHGVFDMGAGDSMAYLYAKNERWFQGEDPKCGYLVNLNAGSNAFELAIGFLDLTVRAVAAYKTGNLAILADATLVKDALRATGLGFVPNVVEGVRALDSLDLSKMSPDGARFAAFGSLTTDFVQALSGVGFDQAMESAIDIIPAPNALIFGEELVGDPILRDQFFSLARAEGNSFVGEAVNNYARVVDPGLARTRDAQELLQTVKRQPIPVLNSLLATPPRVPVHVRPLTLSTGLVGRIREETAYHMVMDAREGYKVDLNDAFARAYSQVLGFPPMAFNDPILTRSGVNGVDMERFSREAVRRAREFLPNLPEPKTNLKEEYPEHLKALAKQLRAKPIFSPNRFKMRDDIRIDLAEDVHRFLGTSFPELSSIPRLREDREEGREESREPREPREAGGLNPYILGIGGATGAWLLWRRISEKT